MGATNSKGVYHSPLSGKQYVSHHEHGHRMLRHAGHAGQRKCLSKPLYAEARGFALTTIYGVPQRLLDRYPPSVYSVQHAVEDIEACKLGRVLPHHKRVVRFDKVARGQDPRIYALTTYHGYKPRDFQDPKVLQLLPYTEKDAQIDISTFQKKGKPYYTVIRHTSTVLDPKRGTVRNWRHKGFENKYRYDLYDPTAAGQKLRRLGNRTGSRFDASKYPLVEAGGQRVRLVPCKVMPAMCKPGDTVFPFLEPGASEKTAKAAAYLEAKKRKVRARREQVEYSKQMNRLARRMKGLNAESNKYKQLAKRKEELRAARRASATKPAIDVQAAA